MPVNIGVLGGTFDPVHNGHLHIAALTRDLFRFERVYFVLAGTPPHKREHRITSPFHRFAMLSLALQPEPAFLASALELEEGASPYTVDTLETLARRLELPAHHLFFLAGGDSFHYIRTWRGYDRLLSGFNVLFIDRPEARIGDAAAQLPSSLRERVIDMRPHGMRAIVPDDVRQGRHAEARIYLLEIGAPEISSTGARTLIPRNEARGLLPAAVAAYIRKHELYRK